MLCSANRRSEPHFYPTRARATAICARELSSCWIHINQSLWRNLLSVKWRTHYADKVKEFRARGSQEAPREGSNVLSFMIHNGVLIQG